MNGEPSASTSGSDAAGPPLPASRGRRVAARVLVVLGALLGVVSIYANFVRREALDKATFRRTSSELIANKTISNQVAATAVDVLYQNVDVAAELSAQLPENLRALANPIAGASRELANRAAVQALSRPVVQAAFVESSSRAQQQFVKILDRKTKLLRFGDDVVLDLRPLVLKLGDRFSIVGNVADRVPQDAGQVTIMKSNDLKAAQDVTRVLRAIANWIWVPMIALWALAVWLARGRRREELHAIAVAFIVVGAAVVVIRGLVGNSIVDGLVANESARPAAREVWRILTDSLAATGWLVLVTGVIATIGIWLYGPARRATVAREWLAPYLNRPGVAWAAYVVLLAVFFWLAPPTRFSFVLIVCVSSAVGFELLRRETHREHPDAQPQIGEALGRWRERLSRRADRAETAKPTAIAEQLERLAKLQSDGAITEQEFTAAKGRLLG